MCCLDLKLVLNIKIFLNSNLLIRFFNGYFLNILKCLTILSLLKQYFIIINCLYQVLLSQFRLVFKLKMLLIMSENIYS